MQIIPTFHPLGIITGLYTEQIELKQLSTLHRSHYCFRLCLPPELEHELTDVEFSLPGKVELRTVLGNVMESVSISNFDVETSEKAVEATSGLTTIEAENALSLAYVCRSAPSNRASSPLKKPQR